MDSDRHVTWITKDYHVHESHSADAPGATVERYCRMAERRGIDEIAFTTHLITTGPDIEYSVAPNLIPEYLDEIQEAQESTSVKLRTGFEVDYFPREERRLERMLDEHHLDYVLGSLHYIHGIDIGTRRGSATFFQGRRVEDALDVYFDGWREAIESGLFDAMAHPDYFRKYLVMNLDTREHNPIYWHQYGTSVYDALDSLKSHGVGVEVNASGWRHGIKDVYPIRGFLEAARNAGVETVTVGSDCHRVDDLGVNTLKAVTRLKEEGYNHLCIFEGRRNRKVSLSDVAL